MAGDRPLGASALMKLLANSVPDIARRAVAVPTKRFGVVAATQGGGTTASVLVDGDDAARDIVSAVPQLLVAGQRVVVDYYPPHGAVVSGVIAVTGSTTTPASSPTEQFWELFAPDHPSSGTADVSGSWGHTDEAGVGWTAITNELTCTIPGLWYVAIQGSWESSGGGLGRAVAMVKNRSSFGTPAAATQIASVAAYVGSGGAATGGYGFVIGGWGTPTFVAGDKISPVARQDSGSLLDLRLRLNLRLIEAS